MSSQKSSVAHARKYSVLDVGQAKQVATRWLIRQGITGKTDFGLPEIDDRYHVWRVPLLRGGTREKVGESVINAYNATIIEESSTKPEVLVLRLSNGQGRTVPSPTPDVVSRPTLSPLKNTIAAGDAEDILGDLPADSVNLIFTSPPYFNARPEYREYLDYDDYLGKMRRIMCRAHDVLSEGRFFVLNVSPVLVRRASRSEASRRIAVPFDFHRLFLETGFDFVDDIIWLKPEGAGWATGRGRRFAADRNPLQYKSVPITEYVLVYRKRTSKLIDWSIRFHPDQDAMRKSKIRDGYERTNVWRIKPAHSKEHPAIFPLELAEKVIQYYSFQNDVVLDPFAGIGTVGRAAAKLGRRFVLIEKEKKYIEILRRESTKWLGSTVTDAEYISCNRPDRGGMLF